MLSGSASELESDLPFWVFVDALDEYVAGLDPRRLQSLEDDVRAELGRVLPSMSEFASSGDVPIQDERYRTHRAVRDLLERLAATKPLVLILDDVHWADSASVELVSALLRRPPAAAVLVAMGARPRQLPERLAPGSKRAHRNGSLLRLELGGLERGEAGELLGGGVDGAVADPFFRGERRQPVLPRTAGSPSAGLAAGAVQPVTRTPPWEAWRCHRRWWLP